MEFKWVPVISIDVEVPRETWQKLMSEGGQAIVQRLMELGIMWFNSDRTEFVIVDEQERIHVLQHPYYLTIEPVGLGEPGRNVHLRVLVHLLVESSEHQ